jgi:uncharacterized membrane protein YphA (DoxX/SURF4 family)
MASTTASRPDWGMVFLRVALGALLVWQGTQLIDEGVGAWLVENTAHRIAEAPDAYAWFGQNIVLRLPLLFAWLIVGGVLAAGCALFVGAFVRPTCAALIFLMLNVYFAGPVNKQEYAALVAVCALACFIANAGTRVGLDRALVGRLSPMFTWTR